MSDLSDRSALLIEAASLGAAELLNRFGEAQTVTLKGDKSNVVSDADFASERCILGAIRAAFPDDTILSEEAGIVQGSSTYSWIVDPLDGTANFASGVPWFGVMIAVLTDNRPQAAAMLLPVQNKLYFGSAGAGVTCNGRPVRVTDEPALENVLCAFGIDCSADPARHARQVRYLTALTERVRNVRATNSLVDLCMTLEGQFGGCINLSTKLWDVAAFSLLIEEAGGSISSPDGLPLDLSFTPTTFGRTVPIAAASKQLHPQLIALCKAS